MSIKGLAESESSFPVFRERSIAARIFRPVNGTHQLAYADSVTKYLHPLHTLSPSPWVSFPAELEFTLPFLKV